MWNYCFYQLSTFQLFSFILLKQLYFYAQQSVMGTLVTIYIEQHDRDLIKKIIGFKKIKIHRSAPLEFY